MISQDFLSLLGTVCGFKDKEWKLGGQLEKMVFCLSSGSLRFDRRAQTLLVAVRFISHVMLASGKTCKWWMYVRKPSICERLSSVCLARSFKEACF